MKVPLQEMPGQRDFAIEPSFVDKLTSGLPMRSALGKEAGVAGEGKATLDFYIEGENVFARGPLSAWVELACSRCLSPLKHSISETLEISFLPEGQVPADDDTEIEEDDDSAESSDTYAYEGVEVDVEPVLRDRLLLAIPYAPVCTEDCKGLCSQCGANLNDSECSCDRKVIDPRLAALKDIKV